MALLFLNHVKCTYARWMMDVRYWAKNIGYSVLLVDIGGNICKDTFLNIKRSFFIARTTNRLLLGGAHFEEGEVNTDI